MGIKVSADEIRGPRTQGWGIVHLKQGERADTQCDHSHPYIWMRGDTLPEFAHEPLSMPAAKPA